MRAKVSIYQPQGNYQLIVEFIEESGIGTPRKAFEQLKQKPEQQGQFAAQHKPIPAMIRHLGVITSPVGAAIRDILITCQH